jgi:hypothetical protein
MAINDRKDILHKIKVKLYPSYFRNIEGTFYARTDNEATLSLEDVCTTLKNRGGYYGKFDDLLDHVRQFFDELAYQICDGYAVNTGYFSIHPNIGGTFNTDKEAHDHNKHPVTFRFRTRRPLRALAQAITVEVQGIADVAGCIDEFLDYDENILNTLYVPGNQFAIHGNKIKIAGDNPDVGLFFVPVDDPGKAVKVSRIADNEPSRITGIAPQTNCQRIRLEIRTQFAASGGILLKAPRVITSGFTLEEA